MTQMTNQEYTIEEYYAEILPSAPLPRGLDGLSQRPVIHPDLLDEELCDEKLVLFYKLQTLIGYFFEETQIVEIYLKRFYLNHLFDEDYFATRAFKLDVLIIKDAIKPILYDRINRDFTTTQQKYLTIHDLTILIKFDDVVELHQTHIWN